MNLKKISNIIKIKRKELGITQEELAQRLFVTEKAVSRWETGRGTPDISLLLPLSKELKIYVSELLSGEENKNDVERIIEYNEIAKTNKYNLSLKLIILLYALSILSFLFYLRFEYDPNVELNYFIRLTMIIFSSILVIFGNKIYGDKYADKKRIIKLSHWITFTYYIILIFNMTFFARFNNINNYNFVPFVSILKIINNKNIYAIIINIFGNLIIFMPLEYFLIELFCLKKSSINISISFIIILAIETVQYVFKIGVFDVDDIILSIFGMVTFYIIYIKIILCKKAKKS